MERTLERIALGNLESRLHQCRRGELIFGAADLEACIALLETMREKDELNLHLQESLTAAREELGRLRRLLIAAGGTQNVERAALEEMAEQIIGAAPSE